MKVLSVMESFAQLFEESLARQEMRQGEVITAEVVLIDHNFVVVNAGLKSESYVPLEEFLNDQGELEVKEGDFVQVAIEMLEDGYGATRLSRDRAKRIAAWNFLEQALNDGALVTGTITGKVKGGLTVMSNGVRAFLPERGDAALRIALVALPEVQQKVGEISRETFFDQLLITSLRPCFSTRRQEDLKRSPRKNN